MKKSIFSFFVMLLIISSCENTPKGVVMEIHSPELSDTTDVFITGSIPALGNWNPGEVKMTSLGNHTWSFTILEEVPDLIEYKFTLGSWKREAADANGFALKNFVLKTTGDTLVKHEINFWLYGDPANFEGQITGNVQYHLQMKGEGILDRDVVVLLPSGYETYTEKQYSVLYMQDGQNLFDPSTSSFGVDWQIDETLDSLDKLGQIEIPIVVGIYNTTDRTADYTTGDQSQAYMKFVVETLKPFIDQTYRTLPEAVNTAVGGSSYGALISFRLAWEYPQVFSKAFCLSPAFKVQNIDYVQNVLDYNGERKALTFYIDNGGIGLEEELQPGIDEMLDVLKKKGYIENTDFLWIQDKEARHFESDWAQRMPNAFKLMYPKK